MGRHEKPLPEDAPAILRRFAQDLRDMRSHAELTLDQLARKSGFLKSQLSEAASGNRLPTEEVLRGFVGGCGVTGSAQALWVRRLQELRQDPEVVQWVGGRADSPRTGSAEDRRGAPRRRILRRLMAAVTVLAAILGVIVAFRDIFQSTSVDGPSGCPRPVSDAAFTATAKLPAGALVRDGASQDFPILRRIPSGCEISFVGYCVGDAIEDPAARLPDVRWLLPADGPGVIASAVTRGQVPKEMAPSTCPGQHEQPREIDLIEPSGEALSGRLQLLASAPGAALVGFAAEHAAASDPGTLRWRQIGMATQGHPFQVVWDFNESAVSQDSVRVIAVICLAGEFPSDFVAARTYKMRVGPETPERSTAFELAGDDRRAARQAACRYPG